MKSEAAVSCQSLHLLSRSGILFGIFYWELLWDFISLSRKQDNSQAINHGPLRGSV